MNLHNNIIATGSDEMKPTIVMLGLQVCSSAKKRKAIKFLKIQLNLLFKIGHLRKSFSFFFF